MHDIAEFLGGRDPFSGLDDEALERLAAATEVEFFPAGAAVYAEGEAPNDLVRVVRRGAIELIEDGRAVDLVEEGELFGHPSTLSGRPTLLGARAAEDTLTYALPESEIAPLLPREPKAMGTASGVGRLPASELVARPAVFLGPETAIRDAARAMTDGRTDAAVIRSADGMLGILTDRDLRVRVVAGGMSPDTPVSQAMSAPAIAVDADRAGDEVILTMLDHDIHHVPVL